MPTRVVAPIIVDVKLFIRVGQAIGPALAAAFDDLEIRAETIITGDIADGSALHGILARCRDLGIQVLDVHIDGAARSQVAPAEPSF
jgi:hypothetical protein